METVSFSPTRSLSSAVAVHGGPEQVRSNPERVFMSPSAKCIHCGTLTSATSSCRKCGNLRPPRSDDISRHEFFKIASPLRGSDAKRMRTVYRNYAHQGYLRPLRRGRKRLSGGGGDPVRHAGAGGIHVQRRGRDLAMGILDEDGSGAIDWVEFGGARGGPLSTFRTVPAARSVPSLQLAAIPAAFDQVRPISDDEFRRVLSNFTFFERHAAKMLAAAKQCRKAAFENDYAHTHQLNATQRTHIFHWTFYGIAFGALMGGVSSVGTMLIDEDIQDRGYPTGGGGGDMTGFWWLVVLSTVLTIIELLVVYVAVVYVAIRISGEAGLRLWPLNPERALVAQSLVRAALELGNSNAPSWASTQRDGRRRWTAAPAVLAFLIYRWKRQLTRFILRFAVRIVVRQVVRFIGAEEQGDDAGQDGFNIAIDFAVNVVERHRRAQGAERLPAGHTRAAVPRRADQDGGNERPDSLAARINLLRTVGVLVGPSRSGTPTTTSWPCFSRSSAASTSSRTSSPKARHIEHFDIDPFHPTGIRFRPGGLEVIELCRPARPTSVASRTCPRTTTAGPTTTPWLTSATSRCRTSTTSRKCSRRAARGRSPRVLVISSTRASTWRLPLSLTSRDALLESMASCDEEEHLRPGDVLWRPSSTAASTQWRTGLLAEAAERCKDILDVARAAALAPFQDGPGHRDRGPSAVLPGGRR